MNTAGDSLLIEFGSVVASEPVPLTSKGRCRASMMEGRRSSASAIGWARIFATRSPTAAIWPCRHPSTMLKMYFTATSTAFSPAGSQPRSEFDGRDGNQ